MASSNSTPRILQQSGRDSDPKPQSGSDEQQPKAGGQKGGEIGEGSYEATRDYQKNIKEYLKDADIEKDAEAAKPRSEQEARDLDEAEKEGRSHSKGER